jgi:hypothetical protein
LKEIPEWEMELLRKIRKYSCNSKYLHKQSPLVGENCNQKVLDFSLELWFRKPQIWQYRVLRFCVFGDRKVKQRKMYPNNINIISFLGSKNH